MSRRRTACRATVIVAVVLAASGAEAYNFCSRGGRLGRPGVDTGAGNHDFNASWPIPDEGTLTWSLERNELAVEDCDASCFAGLEALVQPELDKWAAWLRVGFAKAASPDSAHIRFRFDNFSMARGEADAWSAFGESGTSLEWGLVRIDPDGRFGWDTAQGADDFAYLILHEAGHMLGLGDLYASAPRGAGRKFRGEDFVDHAANEPHLPNSFGNFDNVMETRGVRVLDNDDIHGAQWLWGTSGAPALVTGELQRREQGLNSNEAGPHHNPTQDFVWTQRGTMASLAASPQVFFFFRGITGAASTGPGNWTATIEADRVVFTHAGPYEGNFRFQLDCDQFVRERKGDAMVTGTEFIEAPSYRGPTLFPFAQIFGADCTATHVATTGSDVTGTGTLGSPYRTIQRAIDMAPPGSTVRFSSGTYNECVDYNGKEMHIEPILRPFPGAPPSCTIDGTGICDGVGNTRDYVVDMNGGGTLRGCTIRGGGLGGVRGTGNVSIRDNRFEDNRGRTGAGLSYVSDTCNLGNLHVDVSGNTFEHNTATYDPSILFGGDGGAASFTLRGRVAGPGCAVGGSVEGRFVDNVVGSNSSAQNPNGQARFGGGLIAQVRSDAGARALFQIEGNVFDDNTVEANVTGFGAGAWAGIIGNGSDELLIRNNVFSNNRALGTNSRGGGLEARVDATGTGNHVLQIEGNLFHGNQSGGDGGGLGLLMTANNLGTGDALFLEASRNRLFDNTAFGSQRGGGGGLVGIQLSNRSQADLDFQVHHNQIFDNIASVAGAGASFYVSANADPQNGAGPIAPADAYVAFHDNLVAANAATNPGGTAAAGGTFLHLQAIGDARSGATLVANTITRNEAQIGSGGVEVESFTRDDSQHVAVGQAALLVDSTIIAANTGFGLAGVPPGSPGVVTTGGTGNLQVTVRNSDVFGHPGGNYIGWLGDRTGSAGNISADPLFQDVASGNYQLADSSPAIDAGNPLLVPSGVGGDPPPFGSERDVYGGNRFVDGDGDGSARMDIGAAEHGACPDWDGDGFGHLSLFTGACAEPRGDCDDDDPRIHPDAEEANDGVDNQCPPDAGFGEVDEVGTLSHDASGWAWTFARNAAYYELIRSPSPVFSLPCTSTVTSETSLADAEVPPPGTAHYVLVRAILPFQGSLGRRSDGTPRTACAE